MRNRAQGWTSAELIVARAVTMGELMELRRAMPGVRFVDVRPSVAISQLRGLGMSVDILALTKDHGVADDAWSKRSSNLRSQRRD